ncbi:MAG: 2'-5' RNA ligase family protein [Streptosporangiaceae bacterium]
MYTWHVTFASHPEVGELAARVQARLANLPSLDLIPGPWLHLTMQGIGFTDEVPEADITLILEGARKRLAAVSAPTTTIGPARIVGEGVAFEVDPQDGLTVVRAALREVIAEVRTPQAVPDPDDWTAHVTVAYANTTGPGDAYDKALTGGNGTVDLLVDAVQLIILGRDEHLYKWTTRADVPLGTS